jgi:DNA polymerase I
MARYYDTLLGEYIKNPGQRSLSLDAIAEREFEYEMISYDEVTQKKKLRFDEVDLQDAANYSGEDVYITWKLYEAQKQNPYVSKSKVLHEIEIPLMQVVSRMEMTGIKIDRDILKGIGIRLEQAIGELEREIHYLAGVIFNINSPKQV